MKLVSWSFSRPTEHMYVIRKKAYRTSSPGCPYLTLAPYYSLCSSYMAMGYNKTRNRPLCKGLLSIWHSWLISLHHVQQLIVQTCRTVRAVIRHLIRTEQKQDDHSQVYRSLSMTLNINQLIRPHSSIKTEWHLKTNLPYYFQAQTPLLVSPGQTGNNKKIKGFLKNKISFNMYSREMMFVDAARSYIKPSCTIFKNSTMDIRIV